jgi:uncharacterized protein YjdB
VFKATWVRAAAVAALAVSAAACDGGGATPAAARDLVIVTMATSDVQVGVGETAQLVASAKNGSGSAPVDSWSSSDPNVASVNASGAVTGLREGDVTVTASYRGATGVATVKVRRKQIAKIVVSPRSVSLGALGDTARLSGAAYDASGAVLPAVIGFATPDTQVVAVTGDGKVTARGTGLARVIAQSSGKADTCMVSVVQVVAAVALSPTAQTLQTGQSTVLQAAARDSGGAAISGASFAWASSNAAAVTVDPDGTVHGVGSGSATVTATGSNGVAGTASVSVQAVPIASLSVSPASMSLTAGGTQQLIAVAKDANGNVLTGRVVTWSTSNANVASVSPLGVVFALATGSATVTATSEGKTATAAVTVNAPATSTGSFAAPDLANITFDNGSASPATIWFPNDVTVVQDPTGSGRGGVLRIHYVGANQDSNRSIEYGHKVGFGQTMYLRGQFYLPANAVGMDDGFYQRKLTYWHAHADYNTYGCQGGPSFFNLITMYGNGMHLYAGYVDHAGVAQITQIFLASIAAGRWYSLEQQVTMNSSPSANDGVVRIWLDGVLLLEKTNMRWTDPAWDGQFFGCNGQGSVLSWNDVYFDRFEVGQQVNFMNGSFDEYRYWDNVAFSTRRIGP